MSFLHIFRGNPGEPALVAIPELPHNTSEGSEFLDDAIRMEDLSLTQSVAAGCPEPIDQALSDLKKEGYEADLNCEEDPYGLYCSDLDMRLDPESYHVDEAIRVEDEKHPDEKIVVYAVTYSSGVKGTVVDENKSPSGD
jgi:hypothetical protein